MAQTDRIEKQQLEEVFENIRNETDWDLNDDLLWGYFFTDGDPELLTKAAQELEQADYSVVDIFAAADEEGEDLGFYVLHVEKIETHTVDSLHERNNELYAFAEKHGLETYDGMDVTDLSEEEFDDEEE